MCVVNFDRSFHLLPIIVFVLLLLSLGFIVEFVLFLDGLNQMMKRR